MKKEITCTVCPVGCVVTVEGTKDAATATGGYTCPRGKRFAEAEFLHPVRTLTSTVKVRGGAEPLVAVRTDKPIPRELIWDCMKIIRELTVQAPVERGEALIHNLSGSGADLIATAKAEPAAGDEPRVFPMFAWAKQEN